MVTARPLLLLPLLLAAATPDDEPPLADDGALPQLVADQCTVIPNSSGLVHMRCGTERLIVAQLQPVGAPMHDELLESLLDLVPGPTARLDTSPGDDLVRTEIVQQRLDLDPRETSVVLVLTSRVSTGSE